MKDTIKAKFGYHVRKVRNIITGDEAYRIDDGNNPIFVAKRTDMDTYQYNKCENEMFQLCEVFTTLKGNQFIYWRDNETDEDFVTKV